MAGLYTRTRNQGVEHIGQAMSRAAESGMASPRGRRGSRCRPIFRDASGRFPWPGRGNSTGVGRCRLFGRSMASAAELGVRLHDCPFLGRELAGLLQDESGMPTLPMSCSGAEWVRSIDVGDVSVAEAGVAAAAPWPATAHSPGCAGCGCRFRGRGLGKMGQARMLTSLGQFVLAMRRATSASSRVFWSRSQSRAPLGFELGAHPGQHHIRGLIGLAM
jgi:hypothetical protein